MSLSLIADTATEVNRLAIAGSALASGDYRLKKILPQLEALAPKAPIFGRIAQGVTAVISGTDAAVAGRALLDLSTLLTAIQYTQSPHGVEGEFEPVEATGRDWVPTVAGYRSLSAVVEALTRTGPGRLEVVKDAAERGLFKDLRLMKPALGALHDSYGELSDYVCRSVLPQFGNIILPALISGFDPKGGRPHARRITALCLIDQQQGRAFCRTVAGDATKEVKAAIIEVLTGSAVDADFLTELTSKQGARTRKAATSGTPTP